MASRAQLRRALPDDAAAVLAVVQAGFETYRAFAPAGWVPPDQSEHTAAMRLELADPATFCRIAEVDGATAGVVTWLPAVKPSPDGFVPDVHFRHLFVLEPFWGSGIALELHAEAIAEMRRRGIGVARLYTPAGQARARRFYEREGWTLHFGPYFEAVIGFDLVEYRLNPGH